MSAFEDKLREDLARRAGEMPVAPDVADLQARIDRGEARRDTRFNTVALLGAAAVVVVIVGLALVMTRSEPQLISSATPSTTVQPLSEPVRQRVAIIKAFDRVFEAATPDAQRLAGIMDNAGLDAVAKEFRERDPKHLVDSVRVHVDAVQLVPPSGANVDFSITSSEIPGKTAFSGHAVRVGDAWKVSRATFCAVIDKVGVHCPPTPTTTTSLPA